jgi:hypothetical protein
MVLEKKSALMQKLIAVFALKMANVWVVVEAVTV